MARCRITVLRREFHSDLAEEYCGKDTGPCSLFEDGQEFWVDAPDQPDGFCAWAWHDILSAVSTLMRGGSFTPWMKDSGTIIMCCTDGIRPVVFEIRRIDPVAPGGPR